VDLERQGCSQRVQPQESIIVSGLQFRKEGAETWCKIERARKRMPGTSSNAGDDTDMPDALSTITVSPFLEHLR
jgi:hypothetical protein